MKARLIFSVLVACLFVPIAVHAAKPKKPDDRPKLWIFIRGEADDRLLDIAFETVAEQRKWPVKVEMDSIPPGLQESHLELEIYTEWGPLGKGEPSVRGFLTLTMRGEKQDLGMVSSSVRSPRVDESKERFRERMFLAFANAVAEKIEPVLFPREDRPTP